MEILGLWNYWVVIVMMMTGLYIVMSRENLIKKMMGLNIFQVSVILFYISMGKVEGGTPPIIMEGAQKVIYSNPLPHVLMLTAIVVGVATTAVGLSLAVRIHEAYGSLEERDIVDMDREAEREGTGEGR
jgi:multicomponent Na+:H+ antiporter subunit C